MSEDSIFIFWVLSDTIPEMSLFGRTGNIIWTKHALQRLHERELSQDWAQETLRHPDEKRFGRQPGSTEFIRKFHHSTVSVVAVQNENAEWVVISCWIDPPVQGTKDWKKKQVYKQYRDAGFWKKLWMLALKQLGLTSW